MRLACKHASQYSNVQARIPVQQRASKHLSTATCKQASRCSSRTICQRMAKSATRYEPQLRQRCLCQSPKASITGLRRGRMRRYSRISCVLWMASLYSSSAQGGCRSKAAITHSLFKVMSMRRLRTTLSTVRTGSLSRDGRSICSTDQGISSIHSLLS